MNKKIYGFAFSALALGMLASCNNDVKNVNEPTQEGLPEMQIAKTPELVIWSGSSTLLGSRAGEAVTDEGNKTNKYDLDEVEVNLAIQDVHYLVDANGDYVINDNGEEVEKYEVLDLVSHLSIHVRAAAENVTVTLPVPAKYYCDQDDLFIYGSRNEPFTFAKSENTAIYTIPGEGEENIGTVSLNVTFNDAQDEDEGSITVNVTGVTEEVLAYFKETFNDGVNFDVYNYYIKGNQKNVPEDYEVWTLRGLRDALNESTISFENASNVEYYINAFTGTFVNEDLLGSDADNILRDCTVSPVEESFEEDEDADFYDNLNVYYKNKNYGQTQED